jgi:tartrate-resistant acid phosphatase type 5
MKAASREQHSLIGRLAQGRRRGLPLQALALLAMLVLGLRQAHGQSGTVRFAVIGDFGSAGTAAREVADLVKSWRPDFIITVGDNNYPDGEASTIDPNIGQYYHEFIYPYKGRYGAGATVNRFFPSLGNHDWHASGARPHLEYFTLPGNERYYDFVQGPVHLFAIDSDSHEPDGITRTSRQAVWLQSQLAASTAPWKLVYFHHPPYSSGDHGGSREMQWPFQQWGASAVLAGHDHNYERLLIQGFPYFVVGTGGKSLRAFGPAVAGSQVRYQADYGAMLVTASAESLSFQFYTRTGVLKDSYTMTRSISRNRNRARTPRLTRTSTKRKRIASPPFARVR